MNQDDAFSNALSLAKEKYSSPETEKAVIGKLLFIAAQSQDDLKAAISDLTLDDFTGEQSRKVFQAFQTMLQNGETVDVTTAQNKLKDSVPYLAECLEQSGGTATNITEYIKILHDKHLLRVKLTLASSLYQNVEAPDYTEIASTYIEAIRDIEAPDRLKEKRKNPVLLAMKSFSDFTLKEVEWLVPGKIQRGALNALVGDGGTGKSALASDLAAAISSGSTCVLDDGNDESRKPQRVIYMTAEESGETVLRKRLERMGGDPKRLYLLEQSLFESTASADSLLSNCAVNSIYLLDMIREVKPALLVIDPLQSFIPAKVNLFARNEVRSVLHPLASVAAECNTAVLILMHTNKRSGVSGRNRMADSADIWDIMRSIIITGKTQDGTYYASPEKSNNARQRETTLFAYIREEDGGTTPIQFCETSPLHDRDYQHSAAGVPVQAGVEDDILSYLAEGENGRQKTADLESHLLALGHKKSTIDRAKTALAKRDEIESISTGYSGTKRWYTQLKGKTTT